MNLSFWDRKPQATINPMLTRCLEEILNRKKEKKRERRPEGREKFGLEQNSGLPWLARLTMRWYPLVILNLLEGYAWL